MCKIYRSPVQCEMIELYKVVKANEVYLKIINKLKLEYYINWIGINFEPEK